MTPEEKSRFLVSQIEQLLMQREHKEAEFVAAKAIREAVEAERKACAAEVRHKVRFLEHCLSAAKTVDVESVKFQFEDTAKAIEARSNGSDTGG